MQESNRIEFKRELTDSLEMVEHLGSGIPRILERYPRTIYQFTQNFIRLVLPFSEGFDSATERGAMEVTDQVTDQVTEEVKRLLFVAAQGEVARRVLQDALSLKHVPHFRELYLLPALQGGYLEMSRPDMPNSRLQSYRLTAKGQQWVRNNLKDKKK